MVDVVLAALAWPLRRRIRRRPSWCRRTARGRRRRRRHGRRAARGPSSARSAAGRGCGPGCARRRCTAPCAGSSAACGGRNARRPRAGRAGKPVASPWGEILSVVRLSLRSASRDVSPDRTLPQRKGAPRANLPPPGGSRRRRRAYGTGRDAGQGAWHGDASADLRHFLHLSRPFFATGAPQGVPAWRRDAGGSSRDAQHHGRQHHRQGDREQGHRRPALRPRPGTAPSASASRPAPETMGAAYGSGEPMRGFAALSVTARDAVRAALLGTPDGSGKAALSGMGVAQFTLLDITEVASERRYPPGRIQPAADRLGLHARHRHRRGCLVRHRLCRDHLRLPQPRPRQLRLCHRAARARPRARPEARAGGRRAWPAPRCRPRRTASNSPS